MAKSLVEDLADYLLGLQRGPWSQQYNRACLELWRTTYGEKVALQVESVVKERWEK